MTLELDDIQGLLVRGYGNLQGARYILLRFTELNKARIYLKELLPLITHANQKPVDQALQMALTYEGLSFLKMPPATLSSFSREFKEGMTETHRQFILGDSGENDPIHWQWGNKSTGEIHLLLMIYSTDRETLKNLLTRELERGERLGVLQLHSLPTGILRDHKEHFGFRDDISRPIIAELIKDGPKTMEMTFPAGEFIMGYKNLYDEYASSPTVPAIDDELDVLPSSEHNPMLKDFGKNGTYLVFRQMHQDVCKFWSCLLDKAKSKEGAIKMASKMVGRWPDGTPLTISPEQCEAELSAFNHFGYWEEDKAGIKCPIGSHIRRTNPRDHLVTEKTKKDSTEMVAKHRMLRKGRPYGDPVNEDLEPDKIMDMMTDHKERGLHFICLVTDIRRQFEFVQNSWVNFPKFGGLEHDADPIIGNHYKDGDFRTDEFSIPQYPVREKLSDLPNFTLIRGGGYFFFPELKPFLILHKSEKNSMDKEAEDIQEIIRTMKDFLAKNYPKGEIKRNFHPKMHGCLKARLEIRDDIPEHLKLGLFKVSKNFEAWLRFSNAPPKLQSDKRSSGRGLAIKVLDVPGEVLEADPIGINCQNFLLTTSPILSAWNIPLYKKAIRAVLFGWKERLLFALHPGHWRSLYLTLKYSKKHDNLLAQQYFSGGAFRYGDQLLVKFLLLPHRPTLAYTLPLPKKDDFLKSQLKADLETQDQGFTLHIQVHENEITEPLENTSIVWKKESIPVAELWIPRQDFDFAERIEFGENLSFSPWACLADHEPVGAINRARRRVYKELAAFRKKERSI